MVPDKIYTNNRGVYAELPIFSQIDANVEYIRKEALLKWAKEQKKYFGQRSDELEITDPTNPDIIFFDGKRDAFTALIAKLNSLCSTK